MHLLTANPLTITRDEIDPFEIGKRLSRLNRYGGAGKFPLSVAQHSVLLSLYVPKDLRFAALVHDMAEIWIGEIPCTFKDTIPEIGRREEAILQHIAAIYGKSWEAFADLVPFDRAIRGSEVNALFGINCDDPMGVPVEEMNPKRITDMWAFRFMLETADG